MTQGLATAKLLAIMAACLLGTGCCGARLCSVRFDQPVEALGDSPAHIPYAEPPCGFQTIGGPPTLGGPPPPPMISAPAPRFMPVPTRPVFAPYEVQPAFYGPWGTGPAEDVQGVRDSERERSEVDEEAEPESLDIREVTETKEIGPIASAATSSSDNRTQLRFVNNPLR